MAKLKIPQFWYSTDIDGQSPLISRLLMPFAGLYQAGAFIDRAVTVEKKSPLPVICVGNLTMGGAGKTPTARAILKIIQDHGKFKTPCFLMRGYGGHYSGTLAVDVATHNCWDVGDEALMQAQYAPVIVSRDRYKGAVLAKNLGYDLIIMDDGFQNPKIRKNLSFIVVDGGFGFGNGLCFPAGPLREPVEAAIPRADAAIVINRQNGTSLPHLKPLTQFDGTIVLDDGDDKPGPNGQYIAFAGIARPEKFFNTLKKNGFTIHASHSFPDHHLYTQTDLLNLAERADKVGATLITTEKDWIRLTSKWRKKIAYLTIEIDLEDGFKTWLFDQLDKMS